MSASWRFLPIHKIDFKYLSVFIKFNLFSHKICSKTCSQKYYIYQYAKPIQTGKKLHDAEFDTFLDEAFNKN